MIQQQFYSRLITFSISLLQSQSLFTCYYKIDKPTRVQNFAYKSLPIHFDAFMAAWLLKMDIVPPNVCKKKLLMLQGIIM